MKALYKNRLCYVVEMSSAVTLDEGGSRFVVSLSDEALVVDPTDREVAGAENFREWSGLDAESAHRFRSLLLGELSSRHDF